MYVPPVDSIWLMTTSGLRFIAAETATTTTVSLLLRFVNTISSQSYTD
jgi:hypothetical protein